MPDNNVIKFLDIMFTFHTDHFCWRYQPRCNKQVLPYNSAHSKLVKRSIVKLCFQNALTKSCEHEVAVSLEHQSDRLSQAGYPISVQSSVAEALLRKHRQMPSTEEPSKTNARKIAVIPYFHKISHNLKKVAERSKVKVVFSAPRKLLSLCHRNNSNMNSNACTKKHKVTYVPCKSNVVYRIPISCGKIYIGQTGRCINDRLREHNNNVKNGRDGWLAIHCKTCGCQPVFNACTVVASQNDKLTREIIEAENIVRLGPECVSTPSVNLSGKELAFLRS